MSSLSSSYPALKASLAAHYGTVGPPASPPGDPFVPILAAFLARSLGPAKVARAIAALSEEGLAEATALAEADGAELRAVLAGAGVPLSPTLLLPLDRLARWVTDQGGAAAVRDRPAGELYEKLSALKGIGPTTAATLILHGIGRRCYPVDRSTYRILARHGWIEPTAEPEEVRDLVERLEPDDPVALAQLSTWMEQVGAEFCRPSRAQCDCCPLRPFLPEGGPREPDA